MFFKISQETRGFLGKREDSVFLGWLQPRGLSRALEKALVVTSTGGDEGTKRSLQAPICLLFPSLSRDVLVGR